MCARGRDLADPQLSPDGSWVAFQASLGGRTYLTVVAASGGPESIVSSEPAPNARGGYTWTPDSSALVYAGRDGVLWRVSRSGGPVQKIADHGPGKPVEGPSVSPDGARVAYTVGQRDVAVVGFDGSWPVRLSTNVDFVLDPVWSADGRDVVWHEWDVPNMPWDESRVVARSSDGSGDKRAVATNQLTQFQQPRFSPDGLRLAYLSDADGWLNVWIREPDGSVHPLLAEEHEHGGPTWGSTQRSFVWSPDGMRIALCRNVDGFGELVIVPVVGGAAEVVSRGVHASLSWCGDRVVALRSGARTPTQIVSYDPSTWQRTVLAWGPVAGWDAVDLPEPEVVEWTASDGAVVYGRLYLPRASALGPGSQPPLIAWIHGGPTDQSQVRFNARMAFFLDRGWAILLPDYRGSTGHGRAYTQALRGRWGDSDVDDTATGMRAMAQRGVCAPNHMVVIGGSAGGFTVLNVLARHSDICAAGVDLYGIADLLDLDETTHRFEKHYLHSVVGPLPDTVDRYRSRSPINAAGSITAPLLVLQGGDDKVVPPGQSQTIVDRLRSLGRTVEFHVYDGEGHGWSRPETVIDELRRTEDFLRRHVLRWRA